MKKREIEVPPTEFCEVCRLNHNQGRKHSDRLWCVFCSVDLVKNVPDGSISFPWENVIKHLASSEHLRKLKDFLWTHGAGMDRVDSFRVTEADVLKWEKKCEALKSGLRSSNRGLGGSLQSASKDIQYRISSNFTDVLDTNTVRCFEPTISCGVMPLQRLTTNERCMPSYSEDARVALGSSLPYVGASSSMGAMQQDLGVKGPGSSTIIEQQIGENIPFPCPLCFCMYFTLSMDLQLVVCTRTAASGNGQVVSHYSSYGMDQRMASKKEWRKGPSPRSKMHAEDQTACNAMDSSTCSVSAFSQSGKQPMLNPKRVGAAWSERRRRDLEMEMRGETVISYDPNWLPNFGGVWQAGTRKESRKEFEVQKQKNIKISKQAETSVKIQPYISKRMRTCSNDEGNSSNGYIH